MANAYTLISAHLKFMGSTDPTDANSTSLRAASLDRLQEATEEFWQEMDGSDFQYSRDVSISTTAGQSYVDCPSNFAKFGTSGRLYLRYSADDRRELTPITPHELFELQEKNGSTRAVPEYYCVLLQNGSDYIPQVHFDCLADAAYTLAFYYMKVPPTLSDVNSSSSGLQYIPAEFHWSVLYKGLLAKGARDTGDQRVTLFEQQFQAAMAKAVVSRVHGQEDAERISREGYSAFQMWG